MLLFSALGLGRLRAELGLKVRQAIVDAVFVDGVKVRNGMRFGTRSVQVGDRIKFLDNQVAGANGEIGWDDTNKRVTFHDGTAQRSMPRQDLVVLRDGSQNLTGNLNANSNTITNLASPSADDHAAPKSYVDAQVALAQAGLDPKGSVLAASQAKLDDNTDISGSPTYTNNAGASSRGQITATLAVSGQFNFDGVAMANGRRILLKNEGDSGGLGGAANGIYTVTISGTSLTLDRATDFDADAEVTTGAYFPVEQGTDAGFLYLLSTTGSITIGGASGTALTFKKFGINDHGQLAGLGDDDHSIYALLAGRGAGQTLRGGANASASLTLGSTGNATKGDVVLGETGDTVKSGVAWSITADATWLPATDNNWTIGDATKRVKSIRAVNVQTGDLEMVGYGYHYVLKEAGHGLTMEDKLTGRNYRMLRIGENVGPLRRVALRALGIQ